MIRVTVKNRDAAVVPLSPITSGAVGIPVHFNFSDDWMQEGLTRVACFRNPEVEDVYSMILDETNDTVVPWELLVNHGGVLFIGAYAENGAGTTVIPTIWAEAGMIEEGTKDGEQSADPTPSQWEQIHELAESAADSAAAAESYAEHAPVITNDYWYTWNGESYVTTGQKATGDPGQDGADGVSPDVEITPVTGGHAVTITDKDHPSGQSFNVLDGEDGQDGQDGSAGPPGIAVQATAPTSDVLAWLDTDDDSTVTIPEYSELEEVKNTLNSKANLSDIAIVVNGNIPSASSTTGHYVLLKDSTISGRSDGIYTLSKSISSGSAIDATYLVESSPIAVGGLNNLRDFVSNVNNRFGVNTRFRTFLNTGNIQIDLGFLPSASKYGHIILFNANQNALFGISFGNEFMVRTWSQTTMTLTVTQNDTVVNIVPSSTLWGATTVMIDYN